jgi:prolyl-tRNA synthetase
MPIPSTPTRPVCAETYGAMDQAYRRIFARCGLRAVAVEADSGAIGGSASQEFMVTADAGEDLILASADGRYAANQERAVSLPAEAVPLAGRRAPGRPRRGAGHPGADHDRGPLCGPRLRAQPAGEGAAAAGPLRGRAAAAPAGVLRGDQELNEVKLANAVVGRLGDDHGALLGVDPLTSELLRSEGLSLDLPALPLGYLGPDLDDAVLATRGLWGICRQPKLGLPGWRRSISRSPGCNGRSCACSIPPPSPSRPLSAAPTGLMPTAWAPAGAAWM